MYICYNRYLNISGEQLLCLNIALVVTDVMLQLTFVVYKCVYLLLPTLIVTDNCGV